MKIGTYYFPEQWPREQWERDFDNMVAMDLQLVHMGAYAWHAIEPAPGEFEFDWLNECVELAAKRKLGVILCTPTAAPPVWLVDRYPDVLPVDDAGRRKRFGGRRSYSPTSPAMRDATARVVAALADRFGNHAGVIGWQIDNEYASDFIDQNAHAVAAWREWLGKRFDNSIDKLNAAWGCRAYGAQYTDFAQVLLPAAHESANSAGGTANPHQLLDACRFWSWAFAEFNRLQARILTPRVGERFVTTNYANPPAWPDCNPADMAGDLTLMSWDSYPVVGGEQGVKDQNFRLGDPAQIGLMHDYMATFHGRWGLMQLQPGQVNWGQTAPHLYPGAVRLWLWTALAHGAEFVATHRYRQPRFGPELFHHGLVGPDGVTPSPGGREFQQTIDEVDRLHLGALAGLAGTEPAAATEAATPPAPTPCVGLVMDLEQLWYFKILPQSKRWSYERLLKLWYGAFARLGCAVKVLRPDQEWPASIPIIVCPGLQMVDDATVDKMTAYARGGGHLVLTCRTALMDRTGQLFEGPTAKPIVPLIGGTIEAYDGLPDGLLAKIDLDGKSYDWGVWADLLYSEPETKILAKYDDQFFEGAAAVIQRKLDAGVVTYCGVFGEDAFTNALAEKLATQAKITVTALPPRVQLLRRGPYRLLLNYTTNQVEAPAPARTKFLVGARKVEAAGVAVWKE